MKLAKWTGFFVVVAVFIMAAVVVMPINAAKNGKGKPGSGDGDSGSGTPPVIAITALFAPWDDDSNGPWRITITDPNDEITETKDYLEPLALPLTDAELSVQGGWSHLAETGNYTLQLGGGRNPKKATPSQREITFDFGAEFLLDDGSVPVDNPIRKSHLFMPMNRKYCRDGDPDGDPNTCSSPDQWFNSGLNNFQPGYRDMATSETVPVSVSLWPRWDPDNYRMACTESSSGSFGTAASEHTAFAEATCLGQVDEDAHPDAYPGCVQWRVKGAYRNNPTEPPTEPPTDAMRCGLWLDGNQVGVFDMDFRLHLCREDDEGNPYDECGAPFF